jgi:soluble lytic murein transglycosylase-like protein/outer membrane protein assembly factor BamD (BamD/ComL family)
MKKTILTTAILIVSAFNLFAQTYNDATLARVREQDRATNGVKNTTPNLSPAEHAYRADVYSFNRAFPEARAHWQKILENYPNDANLAKALLGIGRSYMWEREYAQAIPFFNRAIQNYANTKEGRESLAFKGACLVRLGKNAEAAKTYEQYTIMFPKGERIETSFLNIIDALREAKNYDEANVWVDKTSRRFSGLPTATNALHARLRIEIFRENWQKAIEVADALRLLRNFSGSMTSLDEVNYLKAFALEKSGRKADATAVYSAIPNSLNSYFGGLATDKLNKLSGNSSKITRTVSVSSGLTRDYPVVYRTELLRYAKSRNIDPRFVLAIMKQESSFRSDAKSPSAARGLLQLTFDTALKYNKQAGFPNLQAEDLYQPSVNIAIGSAYISELKNQFGGLYEAIAASYNGGEDNAERWLARTKPKDAGIFASEVGFAESKNYVFKVMNNYRAYRELYTEDLTRK